MLLARPVIYGLATLLVLAAYLLIVEILAYSRVGVHLTYFGDAPMWGIVDLCRILHYAPFFLLGAVLCENRPFMMWFIRPSLLAWALGLASVLTLIVLHVHWPQYGRLGAAFAGIAGVLLVRVCLQLAFIFLNRKSRLVQEGVASSYTIYIVHEPILLFASVLAIWLGIGAFSGFFLVFGVTAVVSAALYWITRDVPLASFLLNGVRLDNRSIATRADLKGGSVGS
jgi:peptidoglycan/LPS O-acetylase OafA/YrhL